MIESNKYVQICIQLAALGTRAAMPNPCVGAVVVHNGMIIGQGHTCPYGGPHAEVNAIASVKDRGLLPYSTLYVSLEPCSHFGKTPPCTELIIRSGIRHVVVGIGDPFKAVNGAGFRRLTDAGIRVETGVLEDACYESNKRFFTFHRHRRPYIILTRGTRDQPAGRLRHWRESEMASLAQGPDGLLLTSDGGTEAFGMSPQELATLLHERNILSLLVEEEAGEAFLKAGLWDEAYFIGLPDHEILSAAGCVKQDFTPEGTHLYIYKRTSER